MTKDDLEIDAACLERRLPNPTILIRDTVKVQSWADFDADGIYRRVRRTGAGSWRINPDYQRGPVWTREQQESFLGFWQCGGFVPPIVLWHKKDWNYEILDGQQRVTAIVEWVEGRIDAWLAPYQSSLPFSAIEDFGGFAKCLHAVIYKGNLKGAMRLYASINSTGVPHTRADIEKALEYGRNGDNIE